MGGLLSKAVPRRLRGRFARYLRPEARLDLASDLHHRRPRNLDPPPSLPPLLTGRSASWSRLVSDTRSHYASLVGPGGGPARARRPRTADGRRRPAARVGHLEVPPPAVQECVTGTDLIRTWNRIAADGRPLDNLGRQSSTLTTQRYAALLVGRRRARSSRARPCPEARWADVIASCLCLLDPAHCSRSVGTLPRSAARECLPVRQRGQELAAD